MGALLFVTTFTMNLVSIRSCAGTGRSTNDARRARAPPTPARCGRDSRCGKRIEEHVFRVLLLSASGSAIAALAWLLVSIVQRGVAAPRQPSSGTTSRRRVPSAPARGRRSSARIWVIALTALLTIPVGVGAAVYLEEFARKDRWYNRLIELNIQNLAAVPSIVYGILGLAFIVRGPLDLGSIVLAGGIILVAARAADRDHRVARGDPRGAAVDPRRLAGARRDRRWQTVRPPGAARRRSPASRPA